MTNTITRPANPALDRALAARRAANAPVTQRFDSNMYQAGLAYYGLPANYKRVFTVEGATGFRAISAQNAAAASLSCWVQANIPQAHTGITKACNRDIASFHNLTLDFEYCQEPQKAHAIGRNFALWLETEGWAESGLAIEDSGAGCHIVLPVEAITIQDGDTFNAAVARFVKRVLQPAFDAIAEKQGLAGRIKLEAFDISRVMSLPGTFRPSRKPEDASYLKEGYVRRWLNYTDGTYPVRKENAQLRAALLSELEAPTSLPVPKSATLPAQKGSESGSDWISTYATEKRQEDRSEWFHAVAVGAWLKLGVEKAAQYATDIDAATGGKYGSRALAEVQRSIANAQTAGTAREDFTPQAGLAFPSRTAANAEYRDNFNRTHTGNGLRFWQMHQENVRYVPGWGWLIWNDTRWARDETSQIRNLARQTVTSIYSEASRCEDKKTREELGKWALASESRNNLDAMIHEAESIVGIVAQVNDFDADPMLLNVLNGTLDLTTGELRLHNRADLITKIAPVQYEENANPPTWLAFLDTIMGGNAELIGFLQRAIGYTLSGKTTEHALFFCHGTGSNGKSTLLETLITLMGDYGQTANFDTFLESRGGNGGSANPNIMKMIGARFVKASEADQGKRLAESAIKEMTGGDTIAARNLYESRIVEFRPQFSLWLAANHKPDVRGQDDGIWRRIKLIPFSVRIADADKDVLLTEKLRSELSGILAWAVQGCLSWQANGLQEPDEVKAATAQYKEEKDILGDFFAECCETSAAGKRQKAELSATLRDLYKAYLAFCEDEGEHRPIGRNLFSSKLSERGYHSSRGGHDHAITFYGIAVRNT